MRITIHGHRPSFLRPAAGQVPARATNAATNATTAAPGKTVRNVNLGFFKLKIHRQTAMQAALVAQHQAGDDGSVASASTALNRNSHANASAAPSTPPASPTQATAMAPLTPSPPASPAAPSTPGSTEAVLADALTPTTQQAPASLTTGEILAHWNDWAHATDTPRHPQEDRLSALQTLTLSLNCEDGLHTPYRVESTHLGLGQLHLTSLPEHLPAGIQGLDLRGNHLTRLPEHLPAGLEVLHVGRNRLTHLPENLPASLTRLRANNNQLSSVPQRLPARLTVVALMGNQLVHLPENFASELGAGSTVFLQNNPLSLRTTERLNARMSTPGYGGPALWFAQAHPVTPTSDRAMSSAPASPTPSAPSTPQAGRSAGRQSPIHVSGLPAIPLLSDSPVHRTPRPGTPPAMPRLPGESGFRTPDRPERTRPTMPPFNLRPRGGTLLESDMLPALPRLDQIPRRILTRTQLDGESGFRTPDQPERTGPTTPPFNLRPRGRTLLESDMLPVLPRLQLTVERRELVSRYLSQNMDTLSPARSPSQPRTLGHAVATWANEGAANATDTASPWEAFSSEPGAQAFSQFLDRLRQTVNARDPQFRASVAEWLTHLESHPPLRQNTFLVSEGATTSCEDRVSLTFNAMRKLHLASDVAQGSYDQRLPALVTLARGMFRLDELERISRDHAASLPDADQIEVYLAYQVHLREPLGLPIDTPNMRFFGASDVTKDDLDQAQVRVMNAEEKHFVHYLSSEWQPWQAVMQRLDPAGYEQTQDRLMGAMGDEFTNRLTARLQAMGLENDADAQRTLGPQVQAEITREINGRLTRDFLARHGLLEHIAAPPTTPPATPRG